MDLEMTLSLRKSLLWTPTLIATYNISKNRLIHRQIVLIFLNACVSYSNFPLSLFFPLSAIPQEDDQSQILKFLTSSIG